MKTVRSFPKLPLLSLGIQKISFEMLLELVRHKQPLSPDPRHEPPRAFPFLSAKRGFAFCLMSINILPEVGLWGQNAKEEKLEWPKLEPPRCSQSGHWVQVVLFYFWFCPKFSKLCLMESDGPTGWNIQTALH